jgi:hypothetical protein
MKLTMKDKIYIEKLKTLYEAHDLDIRLSSEVPMRFVLCNNYGDKIQESFGISRQGVRWRFQRLFSEVYVSAYETIYWIESSFGTSLRKDAIAIVKERIRNRRKLQKMGKL